MEVLQNPEIVNVLLNIRELKLCYITLIISAQHRLETLVMKQICVSPLPIEYWTLINTIHVSLRLIGKYFVNGTFKMPIFP